LKLVTAERGDQEKRLQILLLAIPKKRLGAAKT
jgi:hypothetical protein